MRMRGYMHRCQRHLQSALGRTQSGDWRRKASQVTSSIGKQRVFPPVIMSSLLPHVEAWLKLTLGSGGELVELDEYTEDCTDICYMNGTPRRSVAPSKPLIWTV